MKYKVLKKQNNSEMCFVCGIHNDAGLHTNFYELEQEKIISIFKGDEMHQSYPQRMHGGIITALLDETVGRAIQMTEPNTFGVTVELNVRFLKPVPLDQELWVVGEISKVRRILFEGTGYLCTPTHEILATCQAKYMKQDVSTIVENEDFIEEKWIYVDEDDMPHSFDLPQ